RRAGNNTALPALPDGNRHEAGWDGSTPRGLGQCLTVAGLARRDAGTSPAKAMRRTMIFEHGMKRPPETIIPPTAGFALGTVWKETYRIVQPLAEGGFGEVYAAAHTRLPGMFAVKVMHRSLVRNPEALARFRQEAEITSTLRHPHIVQVFDFNVT